ncbi:MAG: LCP family protein [Fimbriimonadaceae bacterium]|nr:LCP family protein [Fimbriimonadaceae bacterium]
MARSDQPSFWGRFFLGLLYSLYLVVFLVGGTVMGWAGQSESLMTLIRDQVTNRDPAEAFAENGVTPDVINLLVLGCDNDVYVQNGAKKTRKGRSDMMMVVQLNFAKNTIRGISIPRDVWVNNMPGVRPNKVNALYVIGGPNLTAAYATDLLGLPIHRVVDLDFVAFQDLVDMAGGVDIFVEKRMKYDDNWADLHIDLHPGPQHLNGYEAMGFVRFRHSDSDFERQKRQKAFMVAVKNAMLARWQNLPHFMNQGVRMTGGGLTGDELTALMRFSKMVEESDIRLEMVPVLDIPGTSNLRVKYDELEVLLTQMGFIRNGRRVGRQRDVELREQVNEIFEQHAPEEVLDEPIQSRTPIDSAPIEDLATPPEQEIPENDPPSSTGEDPTTEPPTDPETDPKRNKPNGDNRTPRLPWDTPQENPPADPVDEEESRTDGKQTLSSIE